MDYRRSLRMWERRERYRRRKWLFYKNESKRPEAERKQLQSKWYKLLVDAKRHVARRKQQIAQATPLRERALNEAKKMIGVMEVGGNNQGKRVMEIIRYNGGHGPEPWCGDFVAWCYKHEGSKVVQRAWAAVRYLGFLTGMKKVTSPLPGDIVCFTFDHTGIFEKSLGNGYIQTIEGNTGRSGAVSDSTTGGDGVYRKRRHVSTVSRYVRVLR